MDRLEEYRALCTQLEETPPALEYTLTRAKAKNRRRNLKRFLGIPAASLAGVFTAFVLLVNLSLPVALACAHVPALLPLLQAVAFSPSLKAAIQHNYAQYIGQSQTVDGITLDLSYLILDNAQLTLLVEADGPYDTYQLLAEFQTLDGEKLPLSSISGDFPGGSLEEAISAYPVSDDFLFPESSCFQLKLRLVSITCLHLLFLRTIRTKHEIFLRKTKFQRQLCLYEVSEMKLSNNEIFATFHLLHRIQMIAITTRSSIKVKLPPAFSCFLLIFLHMVFFLLPYYSLLIRML